MKNFIFRVFFLICAIIFIAEGAALFAARYWRLSQSDIEAFYAVLLKALRMSDITLAIAAGFLVIGFIFLITVIRIGAKRMKPIVVKNKNGVLYIHVEAVRDFVNQALVELDQYLSMSNFKTNVHNKGKWIYINVRAISNGLTPIREEITRLETVIKNHVTEVFGIRHIKINFHIKDININTKAKRPKEELSRKGEALKEAPLIERGLSAQREDELITSEDMAEVISGAE